MFGALIAISLVNATPDAGSALFVVPPLGTSNKAVAAMAADDTGERLATVTSSGHLTLWSLSTRRPLWDARAAEGFDHEPWTVRFIGDWVVTEARGAPARTFRITDGAMKWNVPVKLNGPTRVAFTATTPERIAVRSPTPWGAFGPPPELFIWTDGVKEGVRVAVKIAPDEWPIGEFTPDGKKLVLADGKRLVVCDAQSGAVLREFPRITIPAFWNLRMAFSPQSDRVALLTSDLTVFPLTSTENVTVLGKANWVTWTATDTLRWSSEVGCSSEASAKRHWKPIVRGSCSASGQPAPVAATSTPDGVLVLGADNGVQLVEPDAMRPVGTLKQPWRHVAIQGIDELTGEPITRTLWGQFEQFARSKLAPTTLDATPWDNECCEVVRAKGEHRLISTPTAELILDGQKITCGVDTGGTYSQVAARDDFSRILRAEGTHVWECDNQGKTLREATFPQQTLSTMWPTFADGEPLLYDDTGKAWRFASPQQLKPTGEKQATLPNCGVLAARPTPRGHFVISCSGVVLGEHVLLKERFRTAAISLDGHWAAASTADALLLFDAREGKEIQRSVLLKPGFIAGLAFSPSGDRLYSARESGMLNIDAIPSLKPIAAHLVMGPNQHLTLIDDGRYMATPEAAKELVGLDGSGLPVNVRDFDLDSNRPDLVLATLGASPQRVEEAKRLVEVRRLRMSSDRPALPSLRWAQKLPLQTSSRTLSFTAIPDAPAPQSTVVLAINGARLGTFAIGKPINAVLTPGENRLSVWLEDAQGQRGRRLEHVVTSLRRGAPPEVFFLGVGVSRYREPGKNLVYAAKDVSAVATAMKGLVGSRWHELLLLDDQATTANIAAARTFAAEAMEDDVFIIYLAGHGVRETGQYYFAQHDTQFAEIAHSATSFATLESLLNASHSRQRLLFMDTCESGEIDSIAEASAGATSALGASRGLRVGDTPTVISAGARVTENFIELRDNTGAQIIAASGPVQAALESNEWGNGAFSSAIIHSLRHVSTTDVNRNGRLTASELLAAATVHVKKLTHGIQTPTSRVETIDRDFDLVWGRASTPIQLPRNAAYKGGLFGGGVAPLGARDVVVGEAGFITAWTPEGKLKGKVPWTAEYLSIVGSPDGSRALLAGPLSPAALVDFRKGAVIPLRSRASTGVFSSDGMQLAMLDIDGLEIYSAKDPKRSAQRIGAPPERYLHHARAVEHGWLVLTYRRDDNSLEVWRLGDQTSTEKEPVTLEQPAHGWTAGLDAELSEDGRHVLWRNIGFSDLPRGIIVWDAGTGKVLYQGDEKTFEDVIATPHPWPWSELGVGRVEGVWSRDRQWLYAAPGTMSLYIWSMAAKEATR